MKLSMQDLRQLLRPTDNSHSLKIGQRYFVRTVTHYYTGELTAVTDADIVLEHAAWIADTGRFSAALETGELSEVEPFPNEVIVSRSAIVDVSEWNHDLPNTVK